MYLESNVDILRTVFPSHLWNRYSIQCVDTFNERVFNDLGIYSKRFNHLQHYFHYSDPATDDKISKFLYGKRFDVRKVPLMYLISAEEMNKWVRREESIEEEDEDEDGERDGDYEFSFMRTKNNNTDMRDDIVMNADIATAQAAFTISTKELKNMIMKGKVKSAMDEEVDFLRMYNKLKNSTSRKGRGGLRSINRDEFKNWFMQAIQRED